MLKLGRGMRLQFEKITNSHVLLFPEGIVDLNISAHKILSSLPMERDQLHRNLCLSMKMEYPLEGFDQFIDESISKKWVEEKNSC